VVLAARHAQRTEMNRLIVILPRASRRRQKTAAAGVYPMRQRVLSIDVFELPEG
jgi:hypothetical protein